MTDRPLNHNQTLFVEYLLADEHLRGGPAYEKAYGCTGKAASVGASKLLADPRIKRLVDERKAERMAEAGMTAGEVLKELRAVALADPRDLMEFHRGACRFCYGANHRFHRTPEEYRRDLADYKKNDAAKPVERQDPLSINFDAAGGVGFNPTRAPNKECPECFGRGEGYSYFKDSRTVSAAAARLYAGVKTTKDGLEIKTRSPDKALELMARHLGMLNDKDAGVGGTPEDKAAKVRELVQALGATTGGSSNGAP